MGQLEASVRNLVALYLARSVPVEQLAEGLPDGWDLDEANEAPGNDVALRVMGYLAEYQRGDLDERELRSALAPFAAWTVTMNLGSGVRFVEINSDYEARVSLGAGTESQGVAA